MFKTLDREKLETELAKSLDPAWLENLSILLFDQIPSTNQIVWVASADCTPVLIGDILTGRVSAIHAGWRGTAQRIVPKAVEHFLKQGSQLENLRFVMGPSDRDIFGVNAQLL